MTSEEADDNIENTEEGEEPKQKKLVYTLDYKVQLVLKAGRMVHAEKSVSLKGFSHKHNVDPVQLQRWMKNVNEMKSWLDGITRKKAKSYNAWSSIKS